MKYLLLYYFLTGCNIFVLFLDYKSMVRYLLQLNKYFIFSMCLLTAEISMMGIHLSGRKSKLSQIVHGDTDVL